MSREMVITVGTSLFSSASWEPDGLPQPVPGYDRWSPSLESSPSSRACHGTVRERLEDALTVDNADPWAQALPGELATDGFRDLEARRFSAEMTSLIRWTHWVAEAKGTALTLRELLERYDRIRIVTDPETPGSAQLSHVAAHHLAAALRWILKSSDGAEPSGSDGKPKVSLLQAPGIGSLEPDLLRQGLVKLQCQILELMRAKELHLDLLLTGGYKIYGYLLSPLGFDQSERVRLIYGHEDAEQLVEVSGRHIRVGPGTRIKMPQLEEPFDA